LQPEEGKKTATGSKRQILIRSKQTHMSGVIDPSELTPLTIHEFKLFAPARVNRANSLVYLDTGADHVNISPRLAEGKARGKAITIGSAFEQRTFDTVEDIDIEFLSNNRCANAFVYQVPGEGCPFSIDATLDAPTIFAHALIFDFRLLGILSPKQVSGEAWIEVPAKYLDKGVCIIQLVSQDNTVQALFDTGAGLTVVNSAHVEEIGITLQPAFQLEIHDGTGAKTTQSLARCSGIQAGNIVLPAFDCFSTDLQAIEKALGCRIDMVFGANAMLKSGVRWLFDRPANKAFISG
jgi:hypothetical protein